MQSCASGVPWQFLWKNPVLHKVQKSCPGAVSSDSSSDKNHIDEEIRTAAAARLTAAEYTSCLDLLQYGDTARPNDPTCADDRRDPFCTASPPPNVGVVSVQLCQKRDAVILQLFDATNNMVHYEKYLQWPSSASTGSSTARILQDVALCRVPPPCATPSNLRRRVRKQSPASSVSRQSTRFLEEKAHDVSDALDTLRLLSLGMSPSPSVVALEGEGASESNNVRMHLLDEVTRIAPDEDDMDFVSINSRNTRTSDISAKSFPSEGKEELLMLCVIQNDGTLHWYNVLKLLLHDARVKEQQEKNVEDNFASFFLGSVLFPMIQNRIVPLSQPVATVRLSLITPESRREQQQEEATKEMYTSGKKRRERHYRPPLFHLDLVDASIEPTSSTRRTYGNRITCRVATREYLVIGGCGTRQNPGQKKEKNQNSADPAERSNAGWVTFLFLRTENNFAEAKSMYLPFAPKSLHFVTWEGMDLLVVTNLRPRMRDVFRRALAIRMDTGLSPVPCNGPSPTGLTQYSSFAEMLDQEQSSQHSPVFDTSSVRIRRFEVIPIRMDLLYPEDRAPARGFNPFDSPDRRMEKITLHHVNVSSQASPPGIIAVYNSSSLPAEIGVFVELQTFHQLELNPLFGIGRDFVLSVKRLRGHVAKIQYSDDRQEHMHREPCSEAEDKQIGSGDSKDVVTSEVSAPAAPMDCVSGRGWTLVFSNAHPDEDGAADVIKSGATFFICWEGEKNADFSFFQCMNILADDGGASDLAPAVRWACSVLPEKMPGAKQYRTPKERMRRGSESSASDGFPGISTVPSYRSTQTDSGMTRSNKVIDNEAEIEIFQYAVNSLSMNEQEAPDVRGHLLLSSVESWKSLDGKSSPEWEYQVAKEMLYCQKNELIALSLRRVSSDPSKNSKSEKGTRFDVILSWLCRDGRDFCMAAYIALLLLGDDECANRLRSLTRDERRTLSVIDTATNAEVALRQHVLDGIEPLDCFAGHSLTWILEEGDSVLSHLGPKNLTPLADLTIVCLVKGGQYLSPVLSMFLTHNPHYSANRACIVLVGIFLKKLHGYYERESGDSFTSKDIGELLWPAKSLLCVAVARHCMQETLILLESAAPSEIRGVSDEQLCTPLVRLIVGASSFAPSLLLSLTRTAANGVRQRYWESVSHGQKLILSLLSVEEHYPMLRQTEVRDWVLDMMQRAVCVCANRGDDLETVPSDWLSSLSIACLSNANCRLERLLTTARLGFPASIGAENQFGDNIYLYHHEKEVVKSAFIASSFDLNNLDFNIIIPALLLLQHREQKWHNDGAVSTQALLNHICTLAGRRSASSRFAFQGSTVMKECGLVGNVEAAANLIGGKSGFVLKCCTVIRMKFPEVTMDEAEDALLRGDGRCRSRVANTEDSGDTASFELLDCHRRVLHLLDDYVMCVSKFGDFDPGSARRGGVDPVFASRLCLRLWLILTATCDETTSGDSPKRQVATEWLAEWLSYRLRTGEETESTNGLASAALCRAVLWPAECDYDHACLSGQAETMVMAEELGFSTKFLLYLTESCCGLIESLPASVVERAFAGT